MILFPNEQLSVFTEEIKKRYLNSENSLVILCMIQVLFVCLGNICRSPMAEGIFSKKIEEAGLSTLFKVDSAGTGSWHEGELPDHRTLNIAKDFGFPLNHRARQIRPKDFFDFHYILTMDEIVHSTVVRSFQARPNAQSIIERMRTFDPEAKDIVEVPDPYTGSYQDFIEVYHILNRSCEKLLLELINKHKL